MSVTEDFFVELCSQHHPLLAKTKGTLRLDVSHAGDVAHWRVAIDHGDVSFSPCAPAEPADAVITIERALLDDMLAGCANAMTAVLRGEVGVEGNLGLLLRFQRIFPGRHETAAV